MKTSAAVTSSSSFPSSLLEAGSDASMKTATSEQQQQQHQHHLQPPPAPLLRRTIVATSKILEIPALSEHSRAMMEQALLLEQRRNQQWCNCSCLKGPKQVKSHFTTKRPTMFFDTTPGHTKSVHDIHTGNLLRAVQPFDDESMFFFDALQDLEDNDGNDAQDNDDDDDMYPIITTNSLKAAHTSSLSDDDGNKLVVCLSKPESLLGRNKDGSMLAKAQSTRVLLQQHHASRRTSTVPPNIMTIQEEEEEEEQPPPIITKTATTTISQPKKQSTTTLPPTTTKRRMTLSRHISKRLTTYLSRNKHDSPKFLNALTMIDTIQERGFPGQLSPDEVEQCQRLASALEDPKHRILAEQVYMFRDKGEDQAHALCRWLRSTNFDSTQVIEKLIAQTDDDKLFTNARNHGFFPSPPCSSPLERVLWDCHFRYFSAASRAKNQCPVHYFLAGQSSLEGFLACWPNMQQTFEAWLWNQSYHAFPNYILQTSSKATRRMESILVVDLEGLSYTTACSVEAIQALHVASNVANYFPETLHCIIILNAPKFFGVLWSTVLQKILDPRVLKRIQVFANKEKGHNRLLELIGAQELPQDYGGIARNLPVLPAGILLSIQGQSRITTTRINSDQIHYSDHNYEIRTLSFGAAKFGKLNRGNVSFNVNAGQVLNIWVYTRSSTAAQFKLYKQSSQQASPKKKGQRRTSLASSQVLCQAKIQGKRNSSTQNNNSNGDSRASSFVSNGGIELGTNLVGPGKFVVDAKDLDGTKTIGGKESPSRGYFLVVGEIRG